MSDPGRVGLHTLPDGRVLEYWDGGDPDGRPVIEQTGTPATYALSIPHHEIALECGVRYVTINRPGYGRSTPSDPSLAAAGRDTAELARSLGCSEYAVVGVSGGGPYATATAVVDPGAVRALGLVAAVGPWLELSTPTDEEAEERELIARGGPGRWDEVRPRYLALAEEQMGGLRELDDEARVDAILAEFTSPLVADPRMRKAWVESLRLTIDGPYGFEGYVADGLSWGGAWDIDPKAVSSATLLWYGDADTNCPVSYGQWYADRIPGAQLSVLEGQDHIDVCDGNWSRVFPELLDAWDRKAAQPAQ